MRVTAVLAVLGHHLAEQVFQPLYVREEAGELDDLLNDVASEDPPREAFLRSALLAALSPGKQQEKNRRRLKNVLQPVISTVQPLIADGKQDAFRRALRDLCGRCCEAWSEIQHLEDRVEWSLDDDEPENFELLELPRLEDVRLNRDNSGDQTSGVSKAGPSRHPNSAVSSEPRGNTDSIAAPVWPWFFFRGGDNWSQRASLWERCRSRLPKPKCQASDGPTPAAVAKRGKGLDKIPAWVRAVTRLQLLFIPKWVRRVGKQATLSRRRGLVGSKISRRGGEMWRGGVVPADMARMVMHTRRDFFGDEGLHEM